MHEIYIYCFENSDMMAINQLEERQAEKRVTVHTMGQVKWRVINTEGASVWSWYSKSLAGLLTCW